MSFFGSSRRTEIPRTRTTGMVFSSDNKNLDSIFSSIELINKKANDEKIDISLYIENILKENI